MTTGSTTRAAGRFADEALSDLLNRAERNTQRTIADAERKTLAWWAKEATNADHH